jgi:hypothetical protein
MSEFVICEKNDLGAIADAIRDKTGKTEEMTLDQMPLEIASIVAGGNSGGNTGGMNGIYMAKITPAENISTMDIEHNLGTTDILFALVWIESMGDYEVTENHSAANIWLKTDIPTRVTSSLNRENFEAQVGYSYSTKIISSVGLKNSGSYVRNPTEDNVFTIKAGTSISTYFYGGVTYTVVVAAASAFEKTEE